MKMKTTLLLLAIPLALVFHAIAQDEANKSDANNKKLKFSDSDIQFFEEKVKPILSGNCMECHGDDPTEIGGGLALISRRSILNGGDSGPAVDLKKHSESVLLDAINYGSYEMPPEGKLPQKEIDILTDWVKRGMPWTLADAEKVLENKGHRVPQVNDEAKAFWSFQKVKQTKVPSVMNDSWCVNEIDNFILHRLEESKIKPAAPAAKRDLIRRVYYDLTGLPPSLEEVNAFVKDDSPEAYEKLIDQLLESPHYGEKWGRHWLDLVRYAESNSFERDSAKPFVWRYRDYVIRSFNEDKPYSQFLTEQLAGDELPGPSNDAIIATGFYRLGQWDDEPADRKQAFYDELDDILATTTQTTLGLTVNCARCHDHKIDPIPQKDYYRMLSFFRNVRGYGPEDAITTTVVSKIPPKQSVIDKYNADVADAKRRKNEIVDLVKPDFEPVEHEDFKYESNHERIVHKRRLSNLITQRQYDQFWHGHHDLRKLNKNPPHVDRVMCVTEHGPHSRPTNVLIRGNAAVEGDVVEPGFISVLSPPKPEIKTPKNGRSTGRRLALAKWITSPDNPLTARVMVNRIWQYHFGNGIVRSSNDFGFQGEKPSHPQLLDYLAKTFVEKGWRMKELHRLIMNSQTYKQSNQMNADAYAKDPLNKLLWRFEMRRLTAEEVRDSILAANGRLNRDKMFGPSVYTKLSREVLAGQSIPGSGWGKSPLEDQLRRSIYIHVKRSLRDPILANFDVADTDTSCPVRFNTTQPTQALGLLNSQFTNSEAREFAKEIAAKHTDLREQVTAILSRVTQKTPLTKDVDEGVALIEKWRNSDELSDEKTLSFYCLFAINLNEFIFVR